MPPIYGDDWGMVNMTLLKNHRKDAFGRCFSHSTPNFVPESSSTGRMDCFMGYLQSPDNHQTIARQSPDLSDLLKNCCSFRHSYQTFLVPYFLGLGIVCTSLCKTWGWGVSRLLASWDLHPSWEMVCPFRQWLYPLVI